MNEKSVKKTRGNLPGPGPGRPKGIPNKMTTELKEMILQALDESGGVAYLVRQAEENPKSFMTLLARVLPLQVTGEGGGALTVVVKDYTGRKKDDDASSV